MLHHHEQQLLGSMRKNSNEINQAQNSITRLKASVQTICQTLADKDTKPDTATSLVDRNKVVIMREKILQVQAEFKELNRIADSLVSVNSINNTVTNNGMQHAGFRREPVSRKEQIVEIPAGMSILTNKNAYDVKSGNLISTSRPLTFQVNREPPINIKDKDSEYPLDEDPPNIDIDFESQKVQNGSFSHSSFVWVVEFIYKEKEKKTIQKVGNYSNSSSFIAFVFLNFSN